MKNEKIGLTPINWILSIGGMIILLCIIILPPVFRVFLKEEPEIVETPEEVVIMTLVCTNSNILTPRSTDVSILTFDYSNDLLLSYVSRTEKKYSDSVLYNDDKQLYGKYTAAFSVLSGYRYNLDIDDNLYLLKIEEVYDLDAFQNTTITIPGDTEETQVNSVYKKNDSVSKIREDLINDGYICQ